MLQNITYISLLTILLLGLIIHTALYLFPYSYILRFSHDQKRKNSKNSRAVSETNNTEHLEPIEETAKIHPPVSIIICAKNEGDNLNNFLPLILEQNYPDFEVIVVNDGSVDNTVDVVKKFQNDYNNLYLTHLPQETRIISHKKLALTLGVKAAKNEHLIFTDADCRPLTSDWVRIMTDKMTPGIEFVLGHGAYYRTSGLASTITAYDSLLTAMRYMGFASIGHPYMGVGRNMAYLKSTFLKHKGFAGFLHIASGDDDLLINKFGNSHNVALSPSPESETLSLPKETMREWFYQKKRHLSTSGVYSISSKIRLALEPAATAIIYIASIALLSLSAGNIAIISYALGALFFKFLVQYLIVNATASVYKQRKFGFSLILCDIFLPLTSLYFLLSAKLRYRRNEIVWK